MNYVYPAVFYEEEGKISVLFPDLGNLATFGDNMADAMRMAADACGLYLFTALRDGEPLPTPSTLSDINPVAILKDFEMEAAADSAFVNMVLVDMTEYAKQHSDKAVKKTLSIPMWLNTLCEEKSINFSKVLQDALLSKVQSL
ncbi:MAG: type II toxin-antitoxin system HicB family antitoxin [Butyrivibrio sp.]|nr:type II toxin-antitoxin system HicB family antitoxin [Muribaculum sp.]MCM1552173.1 type II toxin-antitoxin system HicB family antitoxin [Butyrivibrio sp.]